MKWHKVKFKLKSWFASPWQADTIFGHLCWGMKYIYGEDSLQAFLNSYQTGSPPLLLSNGFPGDLLPRPILPTPRIAPSPNLQEQRRQFQHYKKVRDVEYLSSHEFTHAINGQIVVPSSPPDFEMRRVTLKNQLNRFTSTTGDEGYLYSFQEYFWTEVTIYLKLVEEFVEQARRLFHYIADTGFGKRKSTGYGQIENVSFDEFAGFAYPADANGFVTLSNFVPATNDPTCGFWQTLVKYGKMGEEYAQGGNPFKTPWLVLKAGSTFYDSPCREYYGRFIRNLNPRSEAVQYAFALPVPMKLPSMPE